jgi:arginyl-tRNA synthetase
MAWKALETGVGTGLAAGRSAVYGDGNTARHTSPQGKRGAGPNPRIPRMEQARRALLDALASALAEVAPDTPIEPAFESPRQASHGDLAITCAMPLAKPLRRSPRDVAQALVDAMRRQPDVDRWVDAMEIAGPGFINLRLSAAAKQSVVTQVLAEGEGYGGQAAQDRQVMVEFVSANPTGPLHVGHGRQGALGDSICNLLASQGWRVHREFYYNDAGVQIATLARSTQARLRGLKPGDAGWPDDAYHGDYIADIAADYAARKTVRADDRATTASGDPEDLDNIREFAVAYLRHEQDLDLKAFGVRFDHYYLESSLYATGRVEETVQRLVEAGKTYEHDGALWLRSTDYGDDKDRVMRKSAPGAGSVGIDSPADDDAATPAATAAATPGSSPYTYFVPDVAYHIHKWQRGFVKVINVQGSDHHGTIARVRAGLQAAGVGIPTGWPDYVLHKMVTVMRGGQEVKISKRAGGYVTLRDLIDWTSRDAVRFFLVSRKADTEFVFDVDLALKRNDENPVFYVQYAHARICSVIEQYLARSAAGRDGGAGGSGNAHRDRPADDGPALQAWLAQADLSLLTAPTEAALMMKLAEYPGMLTRAATDLAPHDVAFYLRDVAAALHTWYGAERFLVDDAALARARMALLAATRQVLRNALGVLGVGAPQAMMRDASEADGPQTSPAPQAALA